MSAAATTLYRQPKPSSLLWARRSARPNVEVVGYEIENTTVAGAAGQLVAAAMSRTRTTVAFLNAHCVNTAAKDPSYARVLAGATVRYADGSGMAIAARMAGHALVDNVNGTDLLPRLASDAAQAGLSLYLLGGREGVASGAAEALRERHPALKIAGAAHGYFERGSADESQAIARVNVSGADILLVGLGVPQQDVWLSVNRNVLVPPVRLGVGGLFDFFAGRVSRAPPRLRGAGLEWIWRLYQEPERLWRRYLVGNLAFLLHASRQALFTRTHPTRPAMVWHPRARRRERHALAFRRLSGKRLLDVIATSIGLTVLLPVFAASAIAIACDTPGPVFYRQERVGLNGRPFSMVKFRSMVVEADTLHAALQGAVASAHDIRFKAKVDPRVTRVGRFIRRWSLDELPQLWNVLVGDMSLVGPRPALPCEVSHYGAEDRDRLLAMPGITGSWQVQGRADIDFVGQVALDRDYVRRSSMRLDLAILLRTLPAIVQGRGAY